MRSKLLLFLAISRIPSARSFYDVDSDQGCNWSTSMYICVSARFICGGYLASPELNRLNVTAYQIISHYEYVKLSVVQTRIGSDFRIAIPRVEEGDIILSIDVNYCGKYFRQVDYYISAALKRHYEFLWRPLEMGHIRMEDLEMDDYPTNFFDQILVDWRFYSMETRDRTHYDKDEAWRKVWNNFQLEKMENFDT